MSGSVLLKRCEDLVNCCSQHSRDYSLEPWGVEPVSSGVGESSLASSIASLFFYLFYVLF